MTDTSSSETPAPDGNGDPSDGPDGTDKTKSSKGDKADVITLSREEFEELKERRDTANTKARKLEKLETEFSEYKANVGKELKELKERNKAADEEKRRLTELEAEKSGNLEGLRKSFGERETEYQNTISGLQKELEDSQKQLADFQVDVKRSNLRRQATDAAARVSDWPDDVLAPHNFDLEKEFEEVDGKLRAKDSSEDPVTYIRKKLERLGKKHLLRNDRKPGTGADASSSSEDTNGAGMTLDQIKAMPDGGKKYLRENPKVAEQLYANKRLGRT